MMLIALLCLAGVGYLAGAGYATDRFTKEGEKADGPALLLGLIWPVSGPWAIGFMRSHRSRQRALKKAERLKQLEEASGEIVVDQEACYEELRGKIISHVLEMPFDDDLKRISQLDEKYQGRLYALCETNKSKIRIYCACGWSQGTRYRMDVPTSLKKHRESGCDQYAYAIGEEYRGEAL